MAYTPYAWANDAAGNTALNKDNLNHMEQGIFDAHKLAGQLGVGEVLIDSLTSSTSDDDMLLAAEAHHRARQGSSTVQATCPVYKLGPRRYTFTQTFNPPNGFSLFGSNQGQTSVISATHPSGHTQIKLAIVPSTSGTQAPWIDATQQRDSSGTLVAPIGKSLWDFNIGNFNIYSDRADNYFCRGPYLDSNTVGFRECGFYSIVTQNLYSVFGTKAEPMAITACEIAGPGWQIAECRAQGVTLRGSDCWKIFGDGCDWFNISQTAGLGQFMGEFRAIGKSNIGPIYVTATNGWRGLLITGSSTSGLLSLNGAVIEGNNETQPCHGSLIRIEGGNFSMNQCTIDDAMSAPTSSTSPNANTATVNASGQADRGLVEILSGAQVQMTDINWAHANGIDPATMPCVYNSSTKAQLRGFSTFTRGPVWPTGTLPLVKGTTPLVSDASMTLQAA